MGKLLQKLLLTSAFTLSLTTAYAQDCPPATIEESYSRGYYLTAAELTVDSNARATENIGVDQMTKNICETPNKTFNCILVKAGILDALKDKGRALRCFASLNERAPHHKKK